jgi:hypothetical protein
MSSAVSLAVTRDMSSPQVGFLYSFFVTLRDAEKLKRSNSVIVAEAIKGSSQEVR